MLNSKMENGKMFFDSIKKDRGHYFVKYIPPWTSSRFAVLQLIFLEDIGQIDVARTMEKELEVWLEKYPIPVMVSAFNYKDEMFNLSNVRPFNCLIGYIDKKDRKIKCFWKLLKDQELPPDALNPEYLKKTYASIPYKTEEQIVQKATARSRQIRMGSRIIIGWIALPPIIISIIGWRSPIIGGLVVLFSFWKAFEKTMRMLGKWKKTPKELEQENQERLKEHHHYHCLENPEGFYRLRNENFERWARKSIQEEVNDLRTKKLIS